MANVSIMTLIDFYNAVANGDITDEVKAKAVELIEKDAADKEKAKAKRAEKAAASTEDEVKLGNFILGFAKEPMTRSAIFEGAVAAGLDMFGEKALTPQRVTMVCGKLVEAGSLVKGTKSVKTPSGKNGKQTTYCVAQ